MDVHLYIHSSDPVLSAKLDKIIQMLQLQQKEIVNMAVTLDQVIANAQDETTVDNSIIALLTSISSQLSAAGQDPVKLSALNDVISANKAAIAAAVVANTPAAPVVQTPPIA